MDALGLFHNILELKIKSYSSIVNFSPLYLVFYEKVLNAQKRKSNQNQLTKQKQANKKQQRE